MFKKWRLSLPLFSWFSQRSPTMESIIEQVGELSFNFMDDLKHKKEKGQIHKLILKHLENVSSLTNTKLTPDFKVGLEWINVTEPLSLHSHLKGKIIILDFFTYCCINCMHILPDLKRLEQEISVKDGLVVIGVHSAKFTNEKITGNIKDAVRRYDITHPVVNDKGESMWQTLGVHCWPTLYVLGPNSEPLLMLQGEGHYNTLKMFVTEAISFYKKKERLSEKSIPQIAAYSFPKSNSILSYPGKVSVDSDKKLIAISDSAHNRIIVADISGEVMYEIGGTSPGLTDGDFNTAKFFSPQGLVFSPDSKRLYVADTENHCIREINFESKEVSTIVGIGVQGHDYVGGKAGGKQAISSPWDLCLFNDVLLIAMAGTHQIWGYFLQDTVLWKKSYKADTCIALVGSGREENRNNAYPSSAGLAQPSGLAFDGTNFIYFADSESSSIRKISAENGSVSALVGGASDPRNLFAFGDKDGIGTDARLQHPLGVSWSSFDNTLYVADTYNHKIKKVDILSKDCVTVSEQKFNEPAGLCVLDDKIYVADTNNSEIKIFEIKSRSISSLILKEKPTVNDKRCEEFKKTSVTINPEGSDLELEISLTLTNKYSLTKEAPSKWMLYLPGDKVITKEENFTLTPKWNLTVTGNKVKENSIKVKSRLFLCADGKCTVKELLYNIALIFDETAPKNVKCHIDSEL